MLLSDILTVLKKGKFALPAFIFRKLCIKLVLIGVMKVFNTQKERWYIKYLLII